MGNMRSLKKGVAKKQQQNAVDSMPDMEQPVDQNLPAEGQDGMIGVMDSPKAQQEATPEQEELARGLHSLVIVFTVLN